MENVKDQKLAVGGSVIERYVSLKAQVARIEKELKSIQSEFFDACNDRAQNASQIELEQANIIRSSSKRVWSYSSFVLAAKHEWEKRKKNFEAKNKPASGGNPIWIVRVR